MLILCLSFYSKFSFLFFKQKWFWFNWLWELLFLKYFAKHIRLNFIPLAELPWNPSIQQNASDQTEDRLEMNFLASRLFRSRFSLRAIKRRKTIVIHAIAEQRLYAVHWTDVWERYRKNMFVQRLLSDTFERLQRNNVFRCFIIVLFLANSHFTSKIKFQFVSVSFSTNYSINSRNTINHDFLSRSLLLPNVFSCMRKNINYDQLWAFHSTFLQHIISIFSGFKLFNYFQTSHCDC